MSKDAEQAADGDAAESADAPEDDADHADGATADGQESGSLADRVREYDDDLGGEVAELEDRVEELESELADAEDEIEDLTERLQTKQADFQNYKQRAKRRQEEIRERATEDLVERLLDVRDNLDRALDEDAGDVDSLREGVKLTRKEFDRVLDAEGVEEIRPDEGDDVDAQRHEVMMRVESDQPEGTVADVYRSGYEMGGKVLRAAQVTVSDGGSQDDEGDGSENAEADGEDDGEDAAADGEGSGNKDAADSENGGEAAADNGDTADDEPVDE